MITEGMSISEWAVRSLMVARSELGESVVCERLGIDGVELSAMIDGRVEIDSDSLSNLEYLCEMMDQVGIDSGIPAPPPVPPPDSELVDGMVLDLDHSGYVDGDVSTDDVDVFSEPVRSCTFEEYQDKRKGALWRARNLAIMTQFRLDISWIERVAALGAVTQFELALIMCYGETLPEPGGRWDVDRRSREVQRRLARLRWVDRQREKEYSGFKGLMNWVMGRDKLSGKEMYRQMLVEADRMDEYDPSDTLLELGARRGLGPGDFLGRTSIEGGAGR